MPAESHTFLFADLSGFTALTEARGDERAADAVADFYGIVRALLGSYDAEEVKTVGDGVMIRLSRAPPALGLATEIIERVGSRQGALGARVGIHTGTAVWRAGDWLGGGVNLCARVASAARSGEVLLTAATKSAAGEAFKGFEFRYRGSRRFKNVGASVELYALVWDSAALAMALPSDPVCRVALGRGEVAERRSYRGQEYCFCSSECATLFDRHPERYAGRPSAALDLRVSDAARNRAAERLQRAYRRGRLDEAELERRVGVALRARTREDLRAVSHDLPRRRPGPRPWQVPVWPFILLSRAVLRRYRRARARRSK